MSVADKFGLGPKRIEVWNDTKGKWEIQVTPPMWMQSDPTKPLPTLTVYLTQDQYQRYCMWKRGALIHQCLPDLTASQREVLMTGLGDDDFHNATMEDDDDD